MNSPDFAEVEYPPAPGAPPSVSQLSEQSSNGSWAGNTLQRSITRLQASCSTLHAGAETKGKISLKEEVRTLNAKTKSLVDAVEKAYENESVDDSEIQHAEQLLQTAFSLNKWAHKRLDSIQSRDREEKVTKVKD